MWDDQCTATVGDPLGLSHTFLHIREVVHEVTATCSSHFEKVKNSKMSIGGQPNTSANGLEEFDGRHHSTTYSRIGDVNLLATETLAVTILRPSLALHN
jgi:hypothetical protein